MDNGTMMKKTNQISENKNEAQKKTFYKCGKKDIERLDNIFTYHPVKNDQSDRYILLVEQAKDLAHIILNYTPKSREQSLALTKLEEALMHANSAIARNE